jgi:hypothetical protein
MKYRKITGEVYTKSLWGRFTPELSSRAFPLQRRGERLSTEAQLFYVHKGIEKICEGQSMEKCC